MRFCARTKNLSEEENKQFAKNLKQFTKNEMKKFQEEPQEDQGQDES